MTKQELLNRLRGGIQREQMISRIVEKGNNYGVKLTKAVSKASEAELFYILQRMRDLGTLGMLQERLIENPQE